MRRILYAAAASLFATAVGVAILLPRECGFNPFAPSSCNGVPAWGRLLIVGGGLVLALFIAALALRSDGQ